mmetsp:Transcript_1809/g.5795  ORF Transcript_1809/g.5795 Transcript_1809/m.5795 type:complete len:107 (+) Transcript_1809:449-769(+)
MSRRGDALPSNLEEHAADPKKTQEVTLKALKEAVKRSAVRLSSDHLRLLSKLLSKAYHRHTSSASHKPSSYSQRTQQAISKTPRKLSSMCSPCLSVKSLRAPSPLP